MKDHLRGTHRNVAPCLKVPKNVKNEMRIILTSHMTHERYDDMVDSRIYYGGQATLKM